MTFTIPLWIIFGSIGLMVLIAGFIVGVAMGSEMERRAFAQMDIDDFTEWKEQRIAEEQSGMYGG